MEALLISERASLNRRPTLADLGFTRPRDTMTDRAIGRSCHDDLA